MLKINIFHIRLTLILVSILFVNGAVFGVENQINTDSNRLQNVKKKLLSHRYSNTDSTFYYCKLYLKIAESQKDTQSISWGYLQLGYTYYYSNQSKIAIESFDKAISYMGDDPFKNKYNALMGKGVVYIDQGKLDQALRNLIESEKVIMGYDESLRTRPLIYLYYNFCWFFQELNDVEGLNRYFERGMSLIGDDSSHTMFNSYLNVKAQILLRQGDFESCIDLTSKILIDMKEVQDNHEIMSSYKMLGQSYVQLGNTTLGLTYLDSALQVAELTKDVYLRINSRVNLATVYLENDTLIDSAERLVEESVQLNKILNSTLLRERILLASSNLHVNRGEYQKSVETLQKYNLLRDSLLAFRTSEKLLIAENEIAKKNNQLLQLDKEMLELENSRNTTIVLVSAFAVILMAVIILLMIKILGDRTETNNMLKQKQIEIDEKNKELESLNKGKDKLLSIISHDLNQPLSQVYSFAELLQNVKSIDSDTKLIIEEVKKSILVSRGALLNLINWSKAQFLKVETKAESVNLFEFAGLISNELSYASERKSITIQKTIPKDLEVLIDPNHLQIILRNLITNAIKFSYRDTKILIEGSVQADHAIIKVKDFGKGMTRTEKEKLFETEHYFSSKGTLNEKGHGLGMVIVFEYVKENNGTIVLNSEPEKGAEFILKFPLPKNKETLLKTS